MLNGILHAHSGLRWIVLILIVLTVINSFMKWKSKPTEVSSGDNSLFRMNLISAHIMILLGIALFFLSPRVAFDPDTMKVAAKRFFAVEHSLTMIIAVVLMTIGNVKMKKAASVANKYKQIFIYNLVALILILAMIPWPFRGFGTGWF